MIIMIIIIIIIIMSIIIIAITIIITIMTIMTVFLDSELQSEPVLDEVWCPAQVRDEQWWIYLASTKSKKQSFFL